MDDCFWNWIVSEVDCGNISKEYLDLATHDGEHAHALFDVWTKQDFPSLTNYIQDMLIEIKRTIDG